MVAVAQPHFLPHYLANRYSILAFEIQISPRQERVQPSGLALQSFQHGLQDSYLSFNPHIIGRFFLLRQSVHTPLPKAPLKMEGKLNEIRFKWTLNKYGVNTCLGCIWVNYLYFLIFLLNWTALAEKHSLTWQFYKLEWNNIMYSRLVQYKHIQALITWSFTKVNKYSSGLILNRAKICTAKFLLHCLLQFCP